VGERRESAVEEGMTQRAPEASPGAEDVPFGPAAAALVAAGIGAFVLGLLTTLNEMSEAVHDFLELNTAVGPLSGKTVFAVAAWAVSWAILHVALRRNDVSQSAVYWLTGVLVALGILGTLPTFFQLFAGD
jgi:hypothetical protein